MTYKLAKQLKDVGFPQNLDGIFVHEDNYYRCFGIGMADNGSDEVKENGKGYTGCDDTDCPKLVKCPSLSELIEACGHMSLFKFQGQNNWQAEGGDLKIDAEKMRGGYEIRVLGSTPEIAVAKLWLTLNKK